MLCDKSYECYEKNNGVVDETTTANHAYHVFSTLKKSGKTWFLANDSSSGAWRKPQT